MRVNKNAGPLWFPIKVVVPEILCLGKSICASIHMHMLSLGKLGNTNVWSTISHKRYMMNTMELTLFVTQQSLVHEKIKEGYIAKT